MEVGVLSAGWPARLRPASAALSAPAQAGAWRGAVVRRLAPSRHIPLVARADRRDTLSHAPDEPKARVSHETIYAMIYAQPRGGLKAALVEALRQGKHRRGVGRGIGRKPGGGSAIVPESLRIIHRPEEVNARLIPGHWVRQNRRSSGAA